MAGRLKRLRTGPRVTGELRRFEDSADLVRFEKRRKAKLRQDESRRFRNERLVR